jgi:ATP-dependent Clp protease ATP-binding subunit ClpB
MFLGPTGVGKTLLCQEIARFLFNTPEATIRIDMSEFMEKFAVSRLVGAPPGYVGHEEGGQLTEAVRRKPYSVVLLDEIEKAHRDVSNILLQVLDDGHLTDSQGRKVDFRNTIIVMTSNLGAELMAQTGLMDFDQSSHVFKDSMIEIVRKHFTPEFVNRIDEIVVFNRLTKNSLKDIVDVRLREVEERLADRHIKLDVDNDARAWLAVHGYDPMYGARPLNRLIQHKLLNPLAKLIIDGGVRPSETTRVTMDQAKDNLVVYEPDRDYIVQEPDDMAVDGKDVDNLD